jgi:CheY-like chemotaxis protein
VLEQLGAGVVALDGGHQIREKLIQTKPHALIFDIGMPNEDGYSLIRRVRQLPAAEGGQTPAVSLTAHARDEDRARALAAGFDEHLPKPIDIPRLVSTILALTASAGASAPVDNA